MKNSAHYAARLKKLYQRLKHNAGAPETPPPMAPIAALVMAVLSEAAPESKAATALSRLSSSFVDFNELRVSRAEEIVDVLGKAYPQARTVAQRLLTLLHAIHESRHTLDLTGLQQAGKREAKIYLEQVLQASPYTTAWILLHSFEAHAFPVNEALIAMLRAEEVVEPKADPADIQGFLERQISVSQVRSYYALLRAYTDEFNSAKSSPHKKDAPAAKAKTRTLPPDK